MTTDITDKTKSGRTIKKRVLIDEEIGEFNLVYKTHHIEEGRCHLTFGLGDERYILREKNGRCRGSYDIVGFFMVQK